MTASQEFLSQLMSYTKYARYLPSLQRRETYNEIVQRNIEMHLQQYPELEEEIFSNYRFVLNKKVLPSMRSMQFAGKPIQLNPARMYNCAYLPIDDIRAFSEIMFLLLGGSGVGYSVQHRHVSRLPRIRPPHGTVRYLVQDSAIGWADAIKRLFEAYLLGKPAPLFDYRDIRPKGAPLVTAGGRAPGPDPLESAIVDIERLLKRKEVNDQLQPTEVFDIACYISRAVLSGGIRRAATICLFDYDHKEMLTSKTGDWWVDNPQRAFANISAVLDRRLLTEEAFRFVYRRLRESGSGEPGFFFTNDTDWGTNPCGEIALQPFGFCNLTEVNIGYNISRSEFANCVSAASFIGTLQAGYTDFHYLRPVWGQHARADALLGVSLTGIASTGLGALDLRHGANVAADVNKDISARIGIRPAKRITTVKPSGTASLVLGTSSGVHPYWSRWQVRNVRVSKSEPLYDYLYEHARPFVEDSRNEPETAVFSIPLENPEDSAYRDESAIDALSRMGYTYKNWIKPGHMEGLNTHNVSATISVHEHEWDDVYDWLWSNRDTYNGVTLLPFDGGTYTQAPNIKITREEYRSMVRDFPRLDLREINENTDTTELRSELACAGGACEI